MREVARVERTSAVNTRKRELLLSLKHGTIESCFSVPMLTLTMGNMPFLIGFAVKALGWSDNGSEDRPNAAGPAATPDETAAPESGI